MAGLNPELRQPELFCFPILSERKDTGVYITTYTKGKPEECLERWRKHLGFAPGRRPEKLCFPHSKQKSVPQE